MGMGLSLGLSLGATRSGAAAPATPGAKPTTLPFGSSTALHYHVNSGNLTLRTAGTFQGYICDGNTAGVAGNVVVVTAWDSSTCSALRGEIGITGAGVTPTKLIGGAGLSGSAGAGATGKYTIDTVQAVGSAGSPITFTTDIVQVTNLPDLLGLGSLGGGPNGTGAPILMTDARGVKFLRFAGDYNNLTAWLRNITVTGIDSHNLACFVVCRNLASTINPGLPGIPVMAFLGLGAAEIASNPASFATPFGISYGMPALFNRPLSFNNVGDANLPYLFAGAQLQVMGMAIATNDGVNGPGASPTNSGYVYVNERRVLASTSSITRNKNVQGFTFNSTSAAVPTTTLGGSSAFIDVYEIVIFTQGELGNNTQVATRADAVVSALMVNNGILPITRRVVGLGDSRTANGAGKYGSFISDGSGNDICTLLTEPGSSSALPADVCVINYAQAARGIGIMQGLLDQTGAANNTTIPSPLATSLMLGSGKDYFFFFSGINDVSGGGGRWPTSSNGGTAAAGTNAYIDDAYNGPGYTCAFTGTIANGSSTVNSLSGLSGVFAEGMRITSGGGWRPGSAFSGPSTPTTSPASLSVMPIQAALTGISATAALGSYQWFVQTMLARGFKGLWAEEPVYGGTTGVTAVPMVRMRNLVLGLSGAGSGAVVDAGAGPGGAYQGKLISCDLTAISVGGKLIFWTDNDDYSDIYADNVHYTSKGKRYVVSGGDTPANGLSYNLKLILAV